MKKIKCAAVILLLGFLVYHYHNEIKGYINSLPFSIPFLTDDEESKDKGSFEYYFKDNNIHEESIWNIYN